VLERSPGLAARVFTARELQLSGGHRLRAESLAGKWAVKEAVAKVLVDTTGLQWHDCEVLSGDWGQPLLEVRGTVLEASRQRGIERWLVSLSHDGGMAIAFVVAGAEESS
jgi:holo-[acyl-carrier protein] synthase